MKRGFALASSFAFAACRTVEPNAPPPVGPSEPNRATPAPAAVASAPNPTPVSSLAAAPASIRYLISERGVQKRTGAGTETDPEHSVLLGARLPASLLAGIAATYVATYVADAQPFEGFRLEDPPVIVKLNEGPWTHWNKKSAPEPLEPGSKRYREFAEKAAKLAPNMIVRMIEIASEEPRTQEGAHIGSTPEELHSAHPTAKTFAMPGYYSDGDCGFEISHIVFFQETPHGQCDKNGRIAHIWIH